MRGVDEGIRAVEGGREEEGVKRGTKRVVMDGEVGLGVLRVL